MAKKRANGESNIRKRSDGRWEGRYTAGYNAETGKRIIKNVLGKTQAECKAKLAAAMEATKGVDVSRADEYTVATWLRSWYDIYAKPNIRVATADRYRLMIEQYTIPRIGSIKLTKLTAHDLQKLYKELMESGRTNRKSGHGNPGLSSTTVRSLHLMLHNALNRAVKERLILRNPTEDCIAPKVQKFEMQILQPEHIKTYLDAADKRELLPMFYLELVSGLSPPVVTQTISANGCVIAPATRLILSLLISPDGVIIPLSSRVFFIGFSFSSMVPVVPKWCPDVKNKVVKRKTATITRYKKSLCLQGFSQITYKKICGNTGRFWLFHDPRNVVFPKGT